MITTHSQPRARSFVGGACLLAAAGLGAPAASQAAVVDNLAAHYALDETNPASTDVENSAPGAAGGGVRTATTLINQAGQVDAAYALDATLNDAINLGDGIPASLRSTDKVTFSAWINPTAFNPGTNAGSRNTIFATNANISLSTYRADGGSAADVFFNYRTAAGGDNGANTNGSAIRVPLNRWTHVAATRDGANVSIYIDGVSVFQSATEDTGEFQINDFDDGSGGTVPAQLFAGTIAGNDTRDFTGSLDELGVWVGRALDQSTVAVIAGLSRLTGDVALSDDAIDDVLGIYAAQSGVASAGGYAWSYTTSFAAATDDPATPHDESVLAVGQNYLGTDGERYIILGGDSGSGFTGVMTVIPEPAAAGLMAAGLALLAMRRAAD